ncbi:MAG TPA: hypothetical protein VGF07_04715 [Stellaceae bacterium]|jgi:hypothetical protein
MSEASRLRIDDAFVREWHDKYASSDEAEYNAIIAIVSEEIPRFGTISEPTFLEIGNGRERFGDSTL